MVRYDLAAAEVGDYVVEDSLPLGDCKEGKQALCYHQCRSVVGEVFYPARFCDLERPERVVPGWLWDQGISCFDNTWLVDVNPSDVGARPHTKVSTVQATAQVQDCDRLFKM